MALQKEMATNKFRVFGIVSTWKFDNQFKDLHIALLNWNNNINEDWLAPMFRANWSVVGAPVHHLQNHLQFKRQK